MNVSECCTVADNSCKWRGTSFLNNMIIFNVISYIITLIKTCTVLGHYLTSVWVAEKNQSWHIYMPVTSIPSPLSLPRVYRMMEFGLMERFIQRAMTNTSYCLKPPGSEDRSELRPLAVGDFLGVFSLYGAGEIHWKWWKENRHRPTRLCRTREKVIERWENKHKSRWKVKVKK